MKLKLKFILQCTNSVQYTNSKTKIFAYGKNPSDEGFKWNTEDNMMPNDPSEPNDIGSTFKKLIEEIISRVLEETTLETNFSPKNSTSKFPFGDSSFFKRLSNFAKEATLNEVISKEKKARVIGKEYIGAHPSATLEERIIYKNARRVAIRNSKNFQLSKQLKNLKKVKRRLKKKIRKPLFPFLKPRTIREIVLGVLGEILLEKLGEYRRGKFIILRQLYNNAKHNPIMLKIYEEFIEYNSYKTLISTLSKLVKPVIAFVLFAIGFGMIAGLKELTRILKLLEKMPVRSIEEFFSLGKLIFIIAIDSFFKKVERMAVYLYWVLYHKWRIKRFMRYFNSGGFIPNGEYEAKPPFSGPIKYIRKKFFSNIRYLRSSIADLLEILSKIFKKTFKTLLEFYQFIYKLFYKTFKTFKELLDYLNKLLKMSFKSIADLLIYLSILFGQIFRSLKEFFEYLRKLLGLYFWFVFDIWFWLYYRFFYIFFWHPLFGILTYLEILELYFKRQKAKRPMPKKPMPKIPVFIWKNLKKGFIILVSMLFYIFLLYSNSKDIKYIKKDNIFFKNSVTMPPVQIKKTWQFATKVQKPMQLSHSLYKPSFLKQTKFALNMYKALKKASIKTFSKILIQTNKV